MPVTAPETSRDTLSRLRIQRDSGVQRPSLLLRLLKSLLIMFCLLAVSLGGIFLAQQRGLIPETRQLTESLRSRPEVRVAAVVSERGRTADALVVATGFLESRRQARIGARATGRIEQINVEEGSKVMTHDILAVLEHADLDASLNASQAVAARARSELLEQDVEIERTRREFERAEKTMASKSMAPSDFDKARFQRDAAVARKVSLEAALQLAEARVQEASQLRENMFVRAPFEGTVISKDAELGESIMPGGMGEASGRGSVVTIADLDHLEVDCDVKEDFISRVSPDQQAEVSVDAVPEVRYRGRVRKIIPMGDRARATVKVRVEILDADARLFPEMSSTVFFLPDTPANKAQQPEMVRFFCPSTAIVNEESVSFVWLITDDDRLKKSTVTTGASRDARTEITSGLTGGEKVVVNPRDELSDGMLVRTTE